MKKVLSIVALLAVLCASLFVFTGCGSEETSNNNNGQQQSEVITVPMTVMNLYPNTTITKLYISGAGVDNWSDELLQGQQMPTGTQLVLNFNIDKNNVKWDIKATDETGTDVEFRNLDLSNVSTSGGVISLQADENGAPVAVAQ